MTSCSKGAFNEAALIFLRHGPLTRYLKLRRECREGFPCHWIKRKPLVSKPSMHHGTCVTRDACWNSRWRGKSSLTWKLVITYIGFYGRKSAKSVRRYGCVILQRDIKRKQHAYYLWYTVVDRKSCRHMDMDMDMDIDMYFINDIPAKIRPVPK